MRIYRQIAARFSTGGSRFSTTPTKNFKQKLAPFLCCMHWTNGFFRFGTAGFIIKTFRDKQFEGFGIEN